MFRRAFPKGRRRCPQNPWRPREVERTAILEGLENTALMFVTADAAGKIDYASRGAEKLLGNLKGVDMSSPPPFDDPRSPFAALVGAWEAFRQGEPDDQPRMMRAKAKGAPVFLWLQVVPLGDGGRSGCLFLLVDMTAYVSGSEPVRALVSQLAHDLRSPLTSISGAAELLLSGRVGQLVGPQQRLVKIVDDGTQRLAAIIKNVYEEGREGGSAG
jgi:two-component system, NtrC family, sensor histidine kinase PilS